MTFSVSPALLKRKKIGLILATFPNDNEQGHFCGIANFLSHQNQCGAGVYSFWEIQTNKGKYLNWLWLMRAEAWQFGKSSLIVRSIVELVQNWPLIRCHRQVGSELAPICLANLTFVRHDAQTGFFFLSWRWWQRQTGKDNDKGIHTKTMAKTDAKTMTIKSEKLCSLFSICHSWHRLEDLSAVLMMTMMTMVTTMTMMMMMMMLMISGK